jgi:adenylate kinase family enzyme
MPRIAVIGNTGSGKTTVARSVAEVFGITHIELDALHWEADWKEAPREVFRERVRKAVKEESWVSDGNYSKVRDILWGRADTVVWLDYPFHVSFFWLLKRTISRVLTKEKLWNNNQESLRMVLSKDTILLWSIKTFSRRRREFPKLMKVPEYAHIEFIRHRTPKETEEWLKTS